MFYCDVKLHANKTQTWVVTEVDPPLLQLWVVPPVVFGTCQDTLAVCHQHGMRGQPRHFHPSHTLQVWRLKLG